MSPDPFRWRQGRVPLAISQGKGLGWPRRIVCERGQTSCALRDPDEGRHVLVAADSGGCTVYICISTIVQRVHLY